MIGTKVFVGRKQELSKADTLIQAVKRGGEAVYCLQGAAGMGKSVIAREVIGRARNDGFWVLNGSLFDGQELPGLWPWKRILSKTRSIIETKTAEPAWQKLAESHSVLLSNIDSSFADVPELAALPANQRKYRYFEWIGRFLDRFCRLVPVMITLEDLHNSDEDSLHLLEYLLDELEYAPVFFLVSWRPGEAKSAPRIQKVKDKIQFMANHAIAEVGPLARSEIREYLEAIKKTADTEMIDEVISWTEGIPLRVAMYLEILEQRIDGNESKDINQQFWHRLRAELSPASIETLLRLSLLGNGFTKEEILAFVPKSTEATDLFRELMESSAFKRDSEEGYYQFFHDQFRVALTESLDAAEKKRLVGTAVEILEGEKSTQERRTDHLLKELYFSSDDNALVRKGIEHVLSVARAEMEQNSWGNVIDDLERLLEHYHDYLNEEERRSIQYEFCVASENNFRIHTSIPILLELLEHYRNAGDDEKLIDLCLLHHYPPRSPYHRARDVHA